MKDIQRLKLACRRGMWELDMLLENFLEKGYPLLTENEKLAFVKLLEEQDPDLFAWLMLEAKPDNAEFETLIHAIRLCKLRAP